MQLLLHGQCNGCTSLLAKPSPCLLQGEQPHLHIASSQTRICFEATHSNSRGGGQQHVGDRQLPLPIHQEFLHLCFQECEILDIIMKMCCEYPCAAPPALLGSSLGEGWHPSTPRSPCPAMGELQQGLASGGSQPSASHEVLEQHRVLRGLDVSSTCKQFTQSLRDLFV